MRRRSASDRSAAVYERFRCTVRRRSDWRAQPIVPPTLASARATETGITRSSLVAARMTGAEGIKTRNTLKTSITRGQVASSGVSLLAGRRAESIWPDRLLIGPNLCHGRFAGDPVRQGVGIVLAPPLAVAQMMAPGSFGAASRPMAVSHWRPGTLLCVAIAV